ncbi:MAG: 23S rRNA (pseudouridine(1915)-N(3))-methyltransferase RlmH [Pseudomonadota bacterium]
MQILLACVSKPLKAWVKEACNEYEKRLQTELNFRVQELAPFAGGKAAEVRKEKEAERLLTATPRNAFKIALDEKGKQLTTKDFSSLLSDWQFAARDVIVYVGGADGLDQSLLAKVDQTLSLSKMTLPHQIARLMFTEQLYRATTILNNHPYHRD